MHFQNKLDKKLGEKSAEVIDIQFGLYNYDWHYNLMEIKDTLDAVKLLNYSYYLSNKIDYTDIIVAKLTETKTGTIGSKASSVTDAASKGLTYIQEKKRNAYLEKKAEYREEIKKLLEKNQTVFQH